MLIGIEAERANTAQKTGVEHYAKQLILHLAKIDKLNNYRLYLRSKPEQWLLDLPNNFSVKIIPFPIFWTQLRISWEMLFHPVDVLMITASALPLIHPKKSVVTIHDIGWRYYPKSFTRFMRNFLEVATSHAVKNASSVIAVSEATKKDIVKFYGTDPGKITVVHHGYEQANKQISGYADKPSSGSAYWPIGLSAYQLAVPNRYVLFLSTLQPRKNLEGLIAAFRLLKQEYPEIEHKLVIVGKPGWKYGEILMEIDRNKDIVTYLNYVSDTDRLAILSNADLLVQPSFYEGFGMQILEAFAAGVPVAASNISSMPEVAGEAAVYFDPEDILQIKDAIKNILLDKSLSDRLREKGTERLKNFSWEKCARETLSVLVSN